MSLLRNIQVLLPQPGENLAQWAQALTVQLQILLPQLLNDTTTALHRNAIAPLYQDDANTVIISENGQFLLPNGEVLIDNDGLIVTDTLGNEIINGKVVTIRTAQLALGAVTYSRIQDMAANTLIGNAANSVSAPQEISCTATGRDLIASASAAAARTVLGLGNSAVRDVGTTSAHVAAGDAPENAVISHEAEVNPHPQYALFSSPQVRVINAFAASSVAISDTTKTLVQTVTTASRTEFAVFASFSIENNNAFDPTWAAPTAVPREITWSVEDSASTVVVSGVITLLPGESKTHAVECYSTIIGAFSVYVQTVGTDIDLTVQNRQMRAVEFD